MAVVVRGPKHLAKELCIDIVTHMKDDNMENENNVMFWLESFVIYKSDIS